VLGVSSMPVHPQLLRLGRGSGRVHWCFVKFVPRQQAAYASVVSGEAYAVHAPTQPELSREPFGCLPLGVSVLPWPPRSPRSCDQAGDSSAVSR
jgi:hypothetical protein